MDELELELDMAGIEENIEQARRAAEAFDLAHHQESERVAGLMARVARLESLVAQLIAR